MNTIRIGPLQYYICPVKSFEEFALQVEAFMETAKDYKVKVLVFPEYFTTQLLERMIIGDINLSLIDETRKNSTVLPLRDSQTTEEILKAVDHVKLSQ